MENLQSSRMDSWKRIAVSAAAIVVILFGFNSPAWSEGRDIGGKRDIDVATFNLYVGADFTPLLTIPQTDPDYLSKVIAGVVAIHTQILLSNFPVRADALAQQIVGRNPDLVALQEVSLIRRHAPGQEFVVELDYLTILLDALNRHGGHYAVASQVQDTVVEAPLFTGTSFDTVQLADRDVILVRTDLPPGQLRTSNPLGENFSVTLPLPVGVIAVRGWCSVDVEVRGRSFRLINTHLEDQLPIGAPNIQLAQAYELLAKPANTTLPVVLAGDFNSDAYGHYSRDTYVLLTGQLPLQGHFTDAWTVGAQPQELGLTWGHDAFLADLTHAFTFRLDLILYRGKNFSATEASVIDPLLGPIAPRWFSDHAGVFATLAIE